MAGGKSVDELRADGTGLQHGIAKMQMAFEDRFNADELTFLDRALPDSLTFLRVNGGDPNTLVPHCFQRRYASVFLLERLPNRRSLQLGPEDDATSDFLNEWLERDYSALGYQVTPVPVLPPRDRAEFILEKVDRSMR